MRRLLRHFLVVSLFIAAFSSAVRAETPAAPPAPPDVKAQAIIALARSAMLDYLKSRTPADKQIIPDTLPEITQTDLTAVVILRKDGKVVARVIQPGENIYRNVIAAALKAMRSSQLPDRVTADVLNALTVEVHLLGPTVTAITEPPMPDIGNNPLVDKNALQKRQAERTLAALEKFVRPGLIGLKLTQGTDTAYLLPSEAYAKGMDLPAMRRECITLLGRPKSQDEPRTWAVFAATQYVGYPDGTAVTLYRGKIIPPPFDMDETVLLQTALTIGRHLSANQAPDGEYAAGGIPATPREQLYAVYAVARLGRRFSDPALTASAAEGLKFAEKHPVKGGENDPMYSALLSAARQAVANGKPAVLWKKMPPDLKQITKDAPRDELGGFARTDALPTTTDTAIAAIVLAGDKDAMEKRLAARRFCATMTYRPYEAFFSKVPSLWIGAVRKNPATADTSVAACAAAIDALLSQ